MLVTGISSHLYSQWGCFLNYTKFTFHIITFLVGFWDFVCVHFSIFSFIFLSLLPYKFFLLRAFPRYESMIFPSFLFPLINSYSCSYSCYSLSDDASTHLHFLLVFFFWFPVLSPVPSSSSAFPPDCGFCFSPLLLLLLLCPYAVASASSYPFSLTHCYE